ncbi:MAG: ABC transporter ATP-binding protein [Pseudomonadota bacterium]
MISLFRRVLALLDDHERSRLRALLALMVLNGFFNMLGVASILPFLAVLANPDLVESNGALAAAHAALGAPPRDDFLLILGAAVFAAFLTGLIFRTATAYAVSRFGARRMQGFAARLLRSHLERPYAWFLDQHTADLNKSVLQECAQLVTSSLVPVMQLIAQGLLALFLIGLLVAVDPAIAGIAAGLIGGGYALIYLAVRAPVTRLGEERLEMVKRRFRATQESFMGIKTLRTLGLEDWAVARFRYPARRLADIQATLTLYRALPRGGLEALAFGSILAVVLAKMAAGGDLSTVLPVAGVYALAGSRLMPAAQSIFAALSQLRVGRAVLDHIGDEVAEAARAPRRAREEGAPIRLRRALSLRGAVFAYPSSERPVLDGLEMTVRANTTVGIVGGTGAGKTTAVDVVMGLLDLQDGALEVDGAPIRGEAQRRAWRRTVGYVPQQIFLVDASIAGNIAYGVPPERIDHDRVRRAARQAQLHDFVMQELPEGYETSAKDGGLRLSGGQKQRLGIARALYRDPDVLVLDEATSALDNLTERAVMEAVAGLAGAKTIIMIAHRLTTVRNCDEIFLLERGRVAASGTYAQLLERSPEFRAMAESGGLAGGPPQETGAWTGEETGEETREETGERTGAAELETAALETAELETAETPDEMRDAQEMRAGMRDPQEMRAGMRDPQERRAGMRDSQDMRAGMRDAPPAADPDPDGGRGRDPGAARPPAPRAAE